MKKDLVNFRTVYAKAFVGGFLRGAGAMGYYLYGRPSIEVSPGSSADDWKAVGDDLRWAIRQNERKSA